MAGYPESRLCGCLCGHTLICICPITFCPERIRRGLRVGLEGANVGALLFAIRENECAVCENSAVQAFRDSWPPLLQRHDIAFDVLLQLFVQWAVFVCLVVQKHVADITQGVVVIAEFVLQRHTGF